jgi:tRNA (guanine37-N1)-methyltransferase
MRVHVLSIFPEFFASPLAVGIPKRAREAGVLRVSLVDLREYTADRHRTTDDTPYGGGHGMVMKVAPIVDALDAVATVAPRAHRVLLSPRGRVLDHRTVMALAAVEDLVLVCGRYEGIDERVVDSAIDEEISIGDFVLTGGELPAMVLLDAVARHLPGTLGNAESATRESHRGGLLDCPHYTRPENLESGTVPAPLLSGDHEATRRWRLMMALGRTYERRPDLLVGREFSSEERDLLVSYLAERGVSGSASKRESRNA